MKDFLSHYKMKICALSPIYIGNGEKIGKKEYIYLPWDNTVIVPDIVKMYQGFQKSHKELSYQNYMLKNTRDDLSVWLKQQGYKKKDFFEWKMYELEAGDAFLDTGERVKAKNIDCFVKDAYGLPYVPGSSLKGMIRTALLAYELRNHSAKYAGIKEQIRRNSMRQSGRSSCLSQEVRELEIQTFHTLNQDKVRNHATNSNMGGLIISDGAPIPLEQLTLSQKIDYTLDKKENPLPILREALAPGTEIFFDLTIDKSRCPYTVEDILAALEEFQQNCYENFYSRFKRGTKEKNVIWLGGGCGFQSKTVLYPMFGKEAVKVIDGVFKNTLSRKVYDNHKHYKDLSLKIAPHVCKCTRYKGELYDMGMGSIEVLRA